MWLKIKLFPRFIDKQMNQWNSTPANIPQIYKHVKNPIETIIN